MVKDIVLPLVFGFFFGLLLQKAGLSRYHKIVNVFRFKDMAVMKFMMTALCVAMVGVYLLKDLRLIELTKVNETYLVGNLVGGLIFGVGMALAGFCPGTCLAGIGQGSLDYLIPGLLGFLTGAVLFGATYQQVFQSIYALANYGSKTLAQLWNVNHWLLILLFIQASGIAFYFFEKKKL